jgi:hypothetical protein
VRITRLRFDDLNQVAFRSPGKLPFPCHALTGQMRHDGLPVAVSFSRIVPVLARREVNRQGLLRRSPVLKTGRMRHDAARRNQIQAGIMFDDAIGCVLCLVARGGE